MLNMFRNLNCLIGIVDSDHLRILYLNFTYELHIKITKLSLLAISIKQLMFQNIFNNTNERTFKVFKMI